MWLKLSNDRVENILNEDHIKRLLNEGAFEVPDPTIPQAEKSEVVDDGSQSNDGKSDSTGEVEDLRSSGDKSAVRRPGHTGPARREQKPISGAAEETNA
jgi:hypothetical protein